MIKQDTFTYINSQILKSLTALSKTYEWRLHFLKLLVKKSKYRCTLYLMPHFVLYVSFWWHMLFFRSPLANTIHLTDVNDLTKHLVIVCRKAAEAFLTIAGTLFYAFHVTGLFPELVWMNMWIRLTIQLFMMERWTTRWPGKKPAYCFLVHVLHMLIGHLWRISDDYTARFWQTVFYFSIKKICASRRIALLHREHIEC